MPPNDISFEQFFATKIKEKGISLKKLADMTGVAPMHIENLLRGDFADLPPTPYLRGYFIALGRALDFDGEEWWTRLKKEGVMKNSGELDRLPDNRFLKKSPSKYLWLIALGIVIVIYLAFQASRILGRPSLTVSFPTGNPYTTSSSTLTLTGTVSDANSLTLNGDDVPIASDGSWEKEVLLQNGLNTFQISAKKLLGGETTIDEQIWYQSPGGVPTGAPSSTPTNASGTPTGTGTATPGTGVSASSSRASTSPAI